MKQKHLAASSKNGKGMLENIESNRFVSRWKHVSSRFFGDCRNGSSLVVFCRLLVYGGELGDLGCDGVAGFPERTSRRVISTWYELLDTGMGFNPALVEKHTMFGGLGPNRLRVSRLEKFVRRHRFGTSPASYRGPS